jgi:parallel beta-helix repeat protein
VAEGIYKPDQAIASDLDAFVANYNQADKVWLNNGVGVFSDSGQALGNSNSNDVALGDLDGDGDLDAFVANSGDNKVWLNDGLGNFFDSGQALGNSDSYAVELGDVDGDGDLDAFAANYNQPNMVWLNDGQGYFSDSGQRLGNSYSEDVELGDVDGDGDIDAFVANYSQSNMIWLNDGQGRFSDSGQRLGSSDNSDVELGDVDGDDDLDAFVANYAQPNKVWMNDGLGNFFDSGQALGNSNSNDVSLGDLDGDGDLDAFVVNYEEGNKVWLNDEQGNFTDSGQALGNSDSYGVALGDLDGDGDLDAFVANYNQPNMVWLNDGQGNFSDSGQALGNSNSNDVALGNLDGDALSSGDRTATFQLIDGVEIYGGYAGFGEPDPNARDVKLYETILSGDLDGNDVGGLDDPSRGENAYHVVTGNNTEPNAVLDGFTITAGNANVGAYPDATCSGGGMRNDSGSPTLTNCTFSSNSGGYGGGGMDNYNSSSPTLVNCTFSGNSAGGAGGGMANNVNSNPTLRNCAFGGNVSHYGGGMYNEGCSPTLTNCTFSENLAGRYGGGMYSKLGSPIVTNCTFSGNSAGIVAKGTANANNSEPNVIEPKFIWCTGGGMCNVTSSVTVTNCTFSGNSTCQFGGGMYNYGVGPTVTNCTFSGNSAVEGGGGMANNVNSNTMLTNCTFSGNSDSMRGGGMYNFNGSNPTVNNCIFWNDTAPNGPEIYNYDTSSTTIVSYSDIEGGYGGTGNINADPLFADADLRLSTGSPCIDAGDNSVVTVTTDLDGRPRIVNGTVDMGAYEFRIIYVDTNATGANNGSSWEDAFKHLQVALAAVSIGDEIWVAQGTYKPDANSADPNGSGDRDSTFQLINGVTLKGGYAGFGEPDPNARDVQLYETILSGDINTPSDNSDNSYHVVTGSGTDATAVLDGFTITAGNVGDEETGGGMDNYQGSPTVANCTFSGNFATWGGGMQNWESSPTVTNCTFIGNSAEGAAGGGGMFSDSNSSPTVTNCTFSGNTGGGMRNVTSSSPTVTNCIFSGNTDMGMENTDGSNPRVTNCIFSGNTNEGMHNFQSNPTVTNCTFSGNSTNGSGGGMQNFYSNPILTNCTFIGNTAVDYGGGMYNWWSNPILTNCTFSGNSAGDYGGGIYEYNSSPTVTNCILWGNTALVDGNEIALRTSSTIDVNYCDVEGGEAGIYNDGTSSITWGENIGDDPLFKDADGPDNIFGTEDDNLRLSVGSPCIDVGDNTAVPVEVETDLDGHPRIIDGDCNDTVIVDMGAYEFAWAYIGDFDGECDVDFVDFAILALAWLTEPGQTGWNPDCDISISADSYINWDDLNVVADNWLAGTEQEL